MENSSGLINFSSPKKFVDSLYKNRDAINEKTDAFNEKALEVSKIVFNESINLATKVLDNTDRISGGIIALASAGAVFLSLTAGVESVADPQAVKALFGEAPKFAHVLSSVGATITFAYTHIMGRNMMRRNSNYFDTEGL